ncbi:Imm52 family immunity protein [Kribbella lupini]|uniref:Immunity protein 52 domain-containing protein n=1 Tax=Kribbella lupini TaxID=291602 RepID=A0ABN2AUU9_9ACTN
MDEPLITRGFWGPRQETPDQVADRLLTFLAGLDEVVGESVRWSSPESPGQSLAEPGHARRVIADAFRANTDAPQLGINQAYDGSGQRVGKFRISMGVGRYSESPNAHNSFVVRWVGAEALADPILRRVVTAWDPDWGNVTSRSLRDALAGLQPAGKPGPDIGYLTYLSEGRARAMPGGLGQQVVELDGGGVIIGSSESSDLLSVEKTAQLAEVLRPSPAFAPTPTSRSKF